MLNDLLAAFGYKQKWLICWNASIPNRLPSYGHGTYTIRPRLTDKTIGELLKKLASETSEAAGFEVKQEQINITGLAKIGS